MEICFSHQYTRSSLEEYQSDIKEEIIKLLSDNKYSIAQTRSLFVEILDEIEYRMPITSDSNCI